MEERVIIKSEQYNVKKIFKTLIIIGAILSFLIFINLMLQNMERYDSHYEDYLAHQEQGDCGWFYESWETCYSCEAIEKNPTKLGFAIAYTFKWDFYFLLPFVSLSLIGGLIYLWLHGYELMVTDKRVFGKVAWGKQVDLPVDSISAIATIHILKGVSVSTASGRIGFLMIKNADEVYKAINDLLIERQKEKANNINTTATNASRCDVADELKKFKELMDMGVITEEEFDAKKRQLLGL